MQSCIEVCLAHLPDGLLSNLQLFYASQFFCCFFSLYSFLFPDGETESRLQGVKGLILLLNYLEKSCIFFSGDIKFFFTSRSSSCLLRLAAVLCAEVTAIRLGPGTTLIFVGGTLSISQ